MSTDIRSEAPVTPFFSTNFKYYYYFFVVVLVLLEYNILSICLFKKSPVVFIFVCSRQKNYLWDCCYCSQVGSQSVKAEREVQAVFE